MTPRPAVTQDGACKQCLSPPTIGLVAIQAISTGVHLEAGCRQKDSRLAEGGDFGFNEVARMSAITINHNDAVEIGLGSFFSPELLVVLPAPPRTPKN